MKQQQFEQSANKAAIKEAWLQTARECVFKADALKHFRSLTKAGQDELIAELEQKLAANNA